MKSIMVVAGLVLFFCGLEASQYGATGTQENPNNQLFSGTQIPPKVVVPHSKIVIEEQYLLLKLKEEAERYKKQHFNLNFNQNEEMKTELDQEKKIEEKKLLAEKPDDTYGKFLVALNAYTGDLRTGIEEIKEALGLTVQVPNKLGSIEKAVKQVKTGQKKTRWNLSGIIGNVFHLGQYGVLGYLLYYLLTLKK